MIAKAEETKLGVGQELRPTGENIMHVCAEYGQTKLLAYFLQKGGDLASLNYVSS